MIFKPSVLVFALRYAHVSSFFPVVRNHPMAAPSLFICHAFTESDFARDLGLALETCRIPVWRDNHQLRGAERPAPDVRWAIEQARHVIVVLGLNTGEPAWLRREIEMAQEAERRRGQAYRVIPLLLPGTDRAILHHWFTPLPPSPPIILTADGLGAVLPSLLTALGAPPLIDTERHASSELVELVLTFGPASHESAGRRAIAVTLHGDTDSPALPTRVKALINPLPVPISDQILHWYWQDHPRWPTDTVRQIARRTDALLAAWGRRLYQAIFEQPELEPVIAQWREARERRLILQAHSSDSDLAGLLALPWELLHDSDSFLVQHKQPVEFQRRWPGGGDPGLPTPIPMRLLAINPRPDTEPTGHPDPRRSVLPLLDGLKNLGALIEMQALMPPTQSTLEKELNDAWGAGRPFTAVHLDGYWRFPPTEDPGLFAFEAAATSPITKYREAVFLPGPTLATLLNTYRIHLVVLTCSGHRSAALASMFLSAGIEAVITVHPDASPDTLRRFWSAFYEELLRGARIGQAVFAGQRRLANDSYRDQGLGGGGVHLQDGFIAQLHLGHQEPRLALRPPLELWRRLLSQSGANLATKLPEAPATGFVGRGRNLLILQRLLVYQATVFIRGTGSCGKTVTAAALATWLVRCGHYRHTAYLRPEDTDDLPILVENLGQQLLPNGRHWTVASYSNLWQAVDYLLHTMQNQPTLLVLDELEQWPAEHDEVFERFWKKMLSEWPELRLLGLGRIGPPAFAAPWREVVLGPLDDEDAISLISRTLTATDQMPPVTDSGSGFQPLCELATLAGGHAGALQRVAHEISAQGVRTALEQVRTIRSNLLNRHSDDPQWPLYLAIELALKHLPVADQEQLTILAFAKGGINRLVLGHTLELDTLGTDALCERLLALNLIEESGYGHLRVDLTLSSYINGRLSTQQRTAWQVRWRAAMDQLLTFLYQQYFKDNNRTLRLLRLELPNLLALLRDCLSQSAPERSARIASQLEQLLAHLGIPAALAEVIATRERVGQALPGWSRTRFETERLRIERLQDSDSLEDAVQAARQLVRKCQAEKPDVYPGAPYDKARAHFQLGKLLKLASATEPAIRELAAARKQFQILVEAGNANAARIAAVVEAEIGDCLADLRCLQEAATAYEAALDRADPDNATGAANRLQLGQVYQRQSRYADAAALYDAARKTFERLGEPEKAAQAWRQISVAHKLGGQMEGALQAGQKSLYLYEQQRNRRNVAEVLGEVGQLHQILNQLDEATLAYRRMAELYAQLGDGRNEEASRNKLANVLIQLRRPDEARQELYRASECNPPESPTARNWTIRRGLRDVSQGVKNTEIADQARQQAIQKYLAYRRSGGENTNPGTRLCAQIGEALRSNDPEMIDALASKLEQITASPNVPSAGKLLISKLRAILGGERDLALASDPDLHYQYAVELQLLLEELASGNGR